MTERRGAYTAERAASLSGVPWSTVHEWARTGLLIPSVSPVRRKLWSYTDLLGLRTIYWLRHPKRAPDGAEIPGTPMRDVRQVIEHLREHEEELWEEGEPQVRIDRAGRLYVGPEGQSATPHGQSHAEILDLIKPFGSEGGLVGPDLARPRPRLRIIPGKLAGAPHIERTRLETEAVGALAKRGVTASNIYDLYPNFEREGIDDALSLEAQLTRNLEPRLAAVA
jgi:uncharacterized protein (DUF433 family)